MRVLNAQVDHYKLPGHWTLARLHLWCNRHASGMATVAEMEVLHGPSCMDSLPRSEDLLLPLNIQPANNRDLAEALI